MTTLIAVTNYLKKPDNYKQGLEIYETVKQNLKYDNFLQGDHKIDSMQHKMLIRQLQKIHTILMLNPKLIKHVRQIHESAPPTVQQIHESATPTAPIAVRQIHESAHMAVRKIHESAPTTVQQIHKSAPTRIIDHPHINANDLPKNLADKYFEIKSLYPSLRKTREMMISAKSNEERKTYLRKVLKYEEKIQANWRQIDEFTANKQNNESNLMPAAVVAKIIKEKTLLQKYIQRETRNINTKNISLKQVEKKRALIAT